MTTNKNTNKYGIAVGDIFASLMKYNDGNLSRDFFQVVELIGSTMVRIRQVELPIIDFEGAFPIFQIIRDILPPTSISYLDNNENGERRRILPQPNGHIMIKSCEHDYASLVDRNLSEIGGRFPKS